MKFSPAALVASVYSGDLKGGKKRRLNSPPRKTTPPPFIPRSPIPRQQKSPFPKTFEHIKSDISVEAAANCNTGVLHLSTSTGSESFHYWVTDKSMLPQFIDHFREAKGFDTFYFTPYSNVENYIRNYAGMTKLQGYHLDHLPRTTTTAGTLAPPIADIILQEADTNSGAGGNDVEGEASDADGDGVSSALDGLSGAIGDEEEGDDDDDDDDDAASNNAPTPNSASRGSATVANVSRRVVATGTRRAARRKKLNIMSTIHEDNDERYEDDDDSTAVAVLPFVTAAPEVADVETSVDELSIEYSRQEQDAARDPPSSKRKSTFASGGHPTNKKMRVDGIHPFHPGIASPKKKRVLRGNGCRRRRGREQRLGNKKLATGPIFPVVENEAAPPIAAILLEVGTSDGAPEELEVAEFGAGGDVEEELEVADAASIAEEVVDSNGEAGEVVVTRDANGHSKWMVKYQLLVQYKEEHGSCDVPRSTNGLGLWVKKVRVVVILSQFSPLSSYRIRYLIP